MPNVLYVTAGKTMYVMLCFVLPQLFCHYALDVDLLTVK